MGRGGFAGAVGAGEEVEGGGRARLAINLRHDSI